MAKTLDEILRAGKMDPAAIRTMQEEAKKAGLTKRIIHIELDLISGNLKSQATPMDHVMHLGMLEFYKATVLGQMLGRAISKEDEEPAGKPDPAPAPAPAAAVLAPESQPAPDALAEAGKPEVEKCAECNYLGGDHNSTCTQRPADAPAA